MVYKKKQRLFTKALPTLASLLIVAISICGCGAEPLSAQISGKSETENQAKTGMELSPIHFLGKRSDVAIMEQGIYYVGAVSPNVISYYDEETSAAVPLCNRPDCAHNDDTCTAYVEGMPYVLADEQNPDHPLYIYTSNMKNETASYPETQVFSTKKDGSERTLRMKYQTGMVDFAMAASNEFLYFTSEEVDKAENKNVKCLYQADMQTGKCTKLAQYDQYTAIVGAYDQKLILEHNNGSTNGIVADICEFDVTSGEEKDRFHYKAESGDGQNEKPYSAAFLFGEKMYAFLPTENKNAELKCTNLRTGETRTLNESLVYYGNQTAEYGQFADGKLILYCTENRPDGRGITSQTFAIDLETGAVQEIGLQDRDGFGYEVKGATLNHIVISLGQSPRTAQVPPKNGTAEPMTFYATDFYIMEKSDYYGSIDKRRLLE